MLDLTKQPIIYVTRDLERALGLPVNTKGYFIISNFSDFAKSYQKHKNVLLIKEKKILDTWELLQNKQVKKFINNIANIPLNPPFLRGKLDTSPLCKGGPGGILVFKNTLQIEKTCAENNWKLLNPPARISNEVEEKISQITWLGPLKKYLPKYKVLKCKEIAWGKLTLAQRSGVGPFILQFNRSHTGSGTTLIESKKQLQTLQQKFPKREVRIAEYIPGPLFTNNNVVANSEIMVGNINYQITGLKPFTDLPFSTIGNDWALPHKILNKKQIAQYKKIATDVGLRLKKAGWRGLFGIDIVMHEKTGKLYLLEINCRQPASTTYESQLQCHPEFISGSFKVNNHEKKMLKQVQHDKLTTFQAHLLALQDANLKNKKLIKIKNGAQIIQRVTDYIPKLNTPKYFYKPPFNYFLYQNNKPNSDLLRIQTKIGIMEKHNQFNHLGHEIMNFVLATRNNKTWGAPRAGVIIIKDKKILLIKRNKFGEIFYNLPGGRIDKGENPRQASIREAKEETNLNCILDKKKPVLIETNDGLKKHTYYWVKNFTGKIEMKGEELERDIPENEYKLEWVELKKIKNIDIKPKELKKYLL